MKKYALMGAAALLAAAGFASGAFGGDEGANPEGRIYHYVRSNTDGSSPEHVYVYRAAANQIEVYKTVRRCGNAGFVTAWVDPQTGRASMISGGRLMPEARHEDFALLSYDGSNGMLSAEAAIDGRTVGGRTIVEEPVWHLYDFDLASLSLQTMGLADPRAGFSFGLPLVWTDPESGEFVRHLGRAEAEFVGEEDFNGTRALRFEVGGAAFGDNGGPLWIDAESRHVLGARWGVPNRPGMEDFALRLVDVEDGGEAGWSALLTRHFEGCTVA